MESLDGGGEAEGRRGGGRGEVKPRIFRTLFQNDYKMFKQATGPEQKIDTLFRAVKLVHGSKYDRS